MVGLLKVKHLLRQRSFGNDKNEVCASFLIGKMSKFGFFFKACFIKF